MMTGTGRSSADMLPKCINRPNHRAGCFGIAVSSDGLPFHDEPLLFFLKNTLTLDPNS
jgi:hypothetical protein